MITSRALLATGLTLFACAPASAQMVQAPRPERPYRGIFASGMDNSGQSLTGNATFSGGYDDNILAAASNRNSIHTGEGGAFGQFSGGFNYSLNANRGTFNAVAGTSQRYYPSLQDEYFDTYNASVAGTLQVVAKPDITLHQSISYQPYTFLSAFPGEVDPIIGASDIADPDVVPLAQQYVAFEGGVTLGQQLTQRTSFNSNWDYRTTNRDTNQFFRQSAGATFSVDMTRDLSLRLGYHYTRAEYDDRTTEIHRPEIGLDFLHALSLTRRTSLTFGIGTEVTVYNDQTRYNATGNATLMHEIGRSWTTSATYRRGTYFVDTFSEPLTGDSASLQLGGLITRRLQFQAVAMASIGQMGYNASKNFDSYRGTATLSTAITRWMNVGLDYAYYMYAFDSGVELEQGLQSDVTRQSIRAHVSLWAPIFSKARTPNASR